MKRRRTIPWFFLPLVVGVAGCASPWELMPTPNLYAKSKTDPFAEVPAALASNRVDVLYLTDREPENDNAGDRHYGYKRSRSVAFGVSQVELGEKVSWEELVKASRTR